MKIHLDSMNVKGWYCLSFNDFECSLHADEGHIGVNESILTVMNKFGYK